MKYTWKLNQLSYSAHIMKHDDSLPYPQGPIIGPYRQPDESSPFNQEQPSPLQCCPSLFLFGFCLMIFLSNRLISFYLLHSLFFFRFLHHLPLFSFYYSFPSSLPFLRPLVIILCVQYPASKSVRSGF
jgi:hypothetical protein